MNLRQAARELGISHSSVRRRILAGRLQAHRDGRRFIIWPRDIRLYRLRFQPQVVVPAGHPPDIAVDILAGEFSDDEI